MRLVVIGHGMVGARLIDEVRRHDPQGRDIAITVLGAEVHDPYNRVLLSDVVAGRVELGALRLPADNRERVLVLAGAAAVSIDRDERMVQDSDGARHPYDVVVLATGAAAVIPPIPGLPSNPLLDPPVAGIHVLRDLDDARALVAAGSNARRAAVVGAGVLGIEVACGLAARGLQVTLVGRGRVMDRQLDAAADSAMRVALDKAGVAQAHGRLLRVGTQRDRVSALEVDDEHLSADLLVFACGTRPRTELAAHAGLPVRRGVLVGPDLASPRDPRIFAIGDCAQPPGGATGLVWQGWDQARALAARLAASAGERHAPASADGPGPDARPPARDAPAGRGATASIAGWDVDHPATDQAVVTVKADKLVTVAMGAAGALHRTGDRRLVLSDPDAGRHIEIAVRGDRLVGAVCIGDASLAADLTAAFTRATPVPPDPALLLVRQVPGLSRGGADPAALTKMPNRTVICRCNGVSKGSLLDCWRRGARTAQEVAERTRATTGCGTCTDTITDILTWAEQAEGGQQRDASPPTGLGADQGANTPETLRTHS
ncbi:MAG: FAD-dependent oxidoreductase [Actinomycetales bacterium]